MYCALQFLVDIGTSGNVLERTEEVAKKVAGDNPKDFKPDPNVSAQIADEKTAMKFFISVYWCFCYNSESPSHRLHCDKAGPAETTVSFSC